MKFMDFYKSLDEGRNNDFKEVNKKEFDTHIDSLRKGTYRSGDAYMKSGKFVTAISVGKNGDNISTLFYSHPDLKLKSAREVYNTKTKTKTYFIQESLNEGDMKFQALAMAKEIQNQLASLTFIDMLSVMSPDNPAKKEVQELETKVNALTTEVGDFIQKYIPDVADAEAGDASEIPPEEEEEEPKKPAPKPEKKEKVQESLDESRPTDMTGLLYKISKKVPEIEQMVDLWSQADGYSALMRTTDGNAYEIMIRPAKEAQHPGIQRKTSKKIREDLNEAKPKVTDLGKGKYKVEVEDEGFATVDARSEKEAIEKALRKLHIGSRKKSMKESEVNEAIAVGKKVKMKMYDASSNKEIVAEVKITDYIKKVGQKDTVEYEHKGKKNKMPVGTFKTKLVENQTEEKLTFKKFLGEEQ